MSDGTASYGESIDFIHFYRADYFFDIFIRLTFKAFQTIHRLKTSIKNEHWFIMLVLLTVSNLLAMI